MDRIDISSRLNARSAGFALCSAMVAALLAGCSGQPPLASTGAPPVAGAGSDSGRAVPGDAGGDKVLARAEARVAKAPQNASARADLAQLYLAAGRFDSAATTFEDAVSLGDQSPRSGLGLALAYIGSGRNAQALDVLARWQGKVPAGDFGLAVALAGKPAQGVAILTDTLRGGEDTAKVRQNLAYAYALDGRWAEARVVASQDVPADQLDARMGEWASRARPDQTQARVAGLIGAPMRGDPGQPAALALNGVEHAPRTALALSSPELPVPAFGAADAPAAELPPVQSGESFWGATPPQEAPPEAAVVPATFEPETQPEETPSRMFAESFAAAPDTAAPVPAARETARPRSTAHLIQLGSFRTMEGAKRAWGIYQRTNPALRGHTLRITEAEVRGRRYFRVAAEGFDRHAAQTLCSTVKQRGGGCFAYAEHRELPGALPETRGRGPQLATSR